MMVIMKTKKKDEKKKKCNREMKKKDKRFIRHQIVSDKIKTFHSFINSYLTSNEFQLQSVKLKIEECHILACLFFFTQLYYTRNFGTPNFRELKQN